MDYGPIGSDIVAVGRNGDEHAADGDYERHTDVNDAVDGAGAEEIVAVVDDANVKDIAAAGMGKAKVHDDCVCE